MDNLVLMFQQRDAMDACGITVTHAISNNQVVGATITSTSDCKVSLSGGMYLLLLFLIFFRNSFAHLAGAVLSGANVQMEAYGSETTAWVELTANTPVYYQFASAINF